VARTENSRGRGPGRSIAVIVVAVACCAAPASALGATITVNTTADAQALDGLCTLREAITSANADAASSNRAGECAAGNGADTIVVPAGTYNLTVTGAPEDNNASGDLDISGPTTIAGAGAAVTTIDASAAHDRALRILPGASATIRGVTITGGHAPDGASGTSHLGAAGSPGGQGTGDPGGDGEPGGGIRNDGTLSVIDTIMTRNAAGAGGRGGNGAGGAGDTSTNGSDGAKATEARAETAVVVAAS
jgi:CSLREA domain-containing protein